jgi:hypothetical protein
VPRRGLSGQFVGQLEQQGTDRANGFVFVGNQNFAADAGECAEKGGRLWDGIGSGIQVVIKKEKRAGFLIEKIRPLSVQCGAGLSR